VGNVWQRTRRLLSREHEEKTKQNICLHAMPVKRKIPYDSGHFFNTFTCFNWLPLIDITNSYDLVYHWFDYLKAQGNYITGYTIMPNHVHATIAFRKTKKSINTIIGDGKRFIGYEIINRLKAKGEMELLEKLAAAVNKSDRAKGKLYELWEDSFVPKAFGRKECNGTKFIMQKLDYMHNNPCTGKWQLAINAIEYSHSSARFYLTGEQGVYPILNFRQLDDIDLHSCPDSDESHGFAAMLIVETRLRILKFTGDPERNEAE
jgi:hypothetical protein